MSFLEAMRLDSFEKQQDNYNRRLAAELAVIKSAVVRGGLATSKELEDAVTAALAQVDQSLAEKREQANREFRKENPGLAWMADLLNRDREGTP